MVNITEEMNQYSKPTKTWEKRAENTYEVFDILEAWGLDKDFYLGNVIMYLVESRKKCPTKHKEDLEKALVYLQKRIDSIK